MKKQHALPLEESVSLFQLSNAYADLQFRLQVERLARREQACECTLTLTRATRSAAAGGDACDLLRTLGDRGLVEGAWH